MQVPILNGIYADGAPDFRTKYPRNMVPVPKASGISQGYLRPGSGIEQFGTGPGVDRGSIKWNDVMYRVMGSELVSVSASGVVTTLGEVGLGGQVSMDYGFDRLAIASGGNLYYWDGTTLTQVTDPDLGTVNDVKWVAGYYVTTDGTSVIVTELNDPTAVNPLKYGSAESDPDPIMAIDEMRNEIYAIGRYTFEVLQNVGGDFFPFQVIQGAQVPKGAIGTHAYCNVGNTFVFCGSGKGEAPGIYMLVPGDTVKLSTREIDQILLGYTEEQLSQAVMECIVNKNHQFIYLHLPDQCLVYDTMGSKSVQDLVWHTLDSGNLAPQTYRARNFLWCYDKWLSGDPTSNTIGQMVDTVSSHYGAVIGWDFGTQVMYGEGSGAIIHELELLALSGRVALSDDPVIWTSYSTDGETWSMECAISAGRQGQRNKRLCWFMQGMIENWRIQRFRGTSDAHLTFVRLNVSLEPLFMGMGNG